MRPDLPINDQVLNDEDLVIQVDLTERTDAPEYAGDLADLQGSLVELKTQHDNVENVYRLQDIADVILAQESISISDADRIASVYTELFSTVAVREEYTEIPTKTNLIETKGFITDKLSEGKKALVEHQKAYIGSTFQKAENVFNSVMKVNLPELLEKLTEIKELSLSEFLDPNTQKAYFYVYKNGDGKETVYDLKKQTFNACFTDTDAISEDLRKEIVRLYGILGNKHSTYCLTKAFKSGYQNFAGEYGFLHQGYHDSAAMREDFKAVSNYSDLIMFLSSGVLSEFFSDIRDELIPLHKDAKDNIQPYLNAENDIILLSISSKVAEALSDYYEKLTMFALYVWNMSMLIDTAFNVIRLFKEHKAEHIA